MFSLSVAFATENTLLYVHSKTEAGKLRVETVKHYTRQKRCKVLSLLVQLPVSVTLPATMLDQRDETESVEDDKECIPFIPQHSSFDPTPDPMLSMQVVLGGRSNEYLPTISYSQQRDYVNIQRSVEQNEAHNNDSLPLLVHQEGSLSPLNNDDQVSKLLKLRMNNAVEEVGPSYMDQEMEGICQLRVPPLDHCHVGQWLNLEPNFSHESKVYLPDVSSRQKDPPIFYQLPMLEKHPFTNNNASCSAAVPGYKLHMYDCADLALQLHDCRTNQTVSELTDDVLELEGPPQVSSGCPCDESQEYESDLSAPVSNGCPCEESQKYRRDLSLFGNYVQYQGSEVHLQDSKNIMFSSGDISDAVWESQVPCPLQGSEVNLHYNSGEVNATVYEAAGKYHEDMRQQRTEQQVADDQQQAFLNFLRISNAPRALQKFFTGGPDEVGNLNIQGRFYGSGHEPLDLFGGYPSHPVPTSEGLPSEIVAGTGIPCSLPTSQAPSDVLNFQIGTNNVSNDPYRGSSGSELADIFFNSLPNSCFSSHETVKLKYSPYLNIKPARNAENLLTPPLQSHPSFKLERKYASRTQRPVGARYQRGEGTRLKQVFKTEKQRRDFIKERYKTLQDMVPRYSKTDRASIVGDTVHYIHVLLQQINHLSLMKEKRRERKQVQRKENTGGTLGECSTATPRLLLITLAGFCTSNDRELRLNSIHGAGVKFQLSNDELHVSLVQRREPFFLNRLLASLSGFDLVNSSGGMVKNQYVMILVFKIKGNLRETAVEMMAKIMETLDQII